MSAPVYAKLLRALADEARRAGTRTVALRPDEALTIAAYLDPDAPPMTPEEMQITIRGEPYTGPLHGPLHPDKPTP